MPNLEYIIGGLESFLCKVKAKKTCEINGIMLSADGVESIVVMLKAQEPVEYVVHCKNADLSNGTEFACGKCGGSLLHKKVNYCPECGRAVKWE